MNKRVSIIGLVIIILLCLCSCLDRESIINVTDNEVVDNLNQSQNIDISALEYDKNMAIPVVLNNDEVVDVEGKFSQDDNSIILKSGNTYRLTGNLNNKQINLVKDIDDKIIVVFDNVTIDTDKDNAICVKDDLLAYFIVEKGSKNNITLKNNDVSNTNNKRSSVIFSDNDMVFGGEGNLSLKSGFESLIECKNNLTFVSGNYILNTKADALRTKKQLLVKNGNFFIESGDDAIKITSEKSGSFYMENGSIKIKAHDKGINSDNEVYIVSGELNIESKGECISGKQVNINGGKVKLKSYDDAINATDVNQNKKLNQTGVFVRIAGGVVNIDAAMDGIDSNGDLYLEGGQLYINGADNDNERIIDYNGDVILNDANGFEMIGVGPSSKMQNLGETPQQNYIIVYLTDVMLANDDIVVKDNTGNILLSHKTNKSYKAIMITSNKLKEAEVYEIIVGTKKIKVILSKGKNEVIA